ncbi:hypothetical protein [Lactococcus allomyrinae]|uniref:Uncharacterized protein n=1 Tax=Lactococcus allomyrinae TaxID=2419773 RepID=A0A387BGF7_9LACT|nr:hypothetical protein [Lactococcus allomyrinae]AYG01708.1 hypothetical protein D7I46_11975 [Lactococcus allomyrinae]
MTIRQDNELLDGTYGTTSPIQPDNEITAERHRDIVESKANRLNFGENPDETTIEGAFVANINNKLGNLLTQDKIHQNSQSKLEFTVDGSGGMHNQVLNYSDEKGIMHSLEDVKITFYSATNPAGALNVKFSPNLYTIDISNFLTLFYDELDLLVLSSKALPQKLDNYSVDYINSVIRADGLYANISIYLNDINEGISSSIGGTIHYQEDGQSNFYDTSYTLTTLDSNNQILSLRGYAEIFNDTLPENIIINLNPTNGDIPGIYPLNISEFHQFFYALHNGEYNDLELYFDGNGLRVNTIGFNLTAGDQVAIYYNFTLICSKDV